MVELDSCKLVELRFPRVKSWVRDVADDPKVVWVKNMKKPQDQVVRCHFGDQHFLVADLVDVSGTNLGVAAQHLVIFSQLLLETNCLIVELSIKSFSPAEQLQLLNCAHWLFPFTLSHLSDTREYHLSSRYSLHFICVPITITLLD